jgi:hypothetical protein
MVAVVIKSPCTKGRASDQSVHAIGILGRPALYFCDDFISGSSGTASGSKGLINQIPSDDPSLITLYEHLDQIASQKGDFDKSLQWQQKLLSLKQQTITTDQKASSTVIKKLKRYPTGDTYDGQFLNDLYHGYGIYTWKIGNQCEGMWEKNR